MGQSLLVFSASDTGASRLSELAASWGCRIATCRTVDELRGQLEGARFDLVLVESSQALQRLIGEADQNEVLQLPLSAIEERHIRRVLAATRGNKTRAARLLEIDTKTLYNKLKSYEASARRRDRVAAEGG